MDNGGSSGEALTLDLGERAEWLDDGVFQSVDGRSARKGAEHIGGKGGIVRTDFDDPPASGPAGFFVPGLNAGGEETSEARSDAHAGEEGPFPPDLARAAGVVALARIVERGGHGVVEAERSFLPDPRDEAGG